MPIVCLPIGVVSDCVFAIYPFADTPTAGFMCALCSRY